MKNRELDYTDCVEIAEGTYWVGFADERAGLHCNPYLITDGREAVLIDGGNRNDFSTVMLKILRTGTNPNHIIRLIYHHYDPDLCGNLPHLEAIIGGRELKVISHRSNNVFIDYYSPKSPKECIEEMGFHFDFSSGRRLEFIRTPYAHSPGSFVTYDTKTKILFSSDIFGSFDSNWSLYTAILEDCAACEQPAQRQTQTQKKPCPVTKQSCQIAGILDFHKSVMTSEKALRYALSQIENLDISLIAPQHGSIFHTPVSQKIVIERLKSLTEIGIDNFLREKGE